jgi:hypothetical protein
MSIKMRHHVSFLMIRWAVAKRLRTLVRRVRLAEGVTRHLGPSEWLFGWLL